MIQFEQKTMQALQENNQENAQRHNQECDQEYTHEYFMRLALEEAKKAFALDEVPIGAVIVRQNEVIARAHNLKHNLNMATKHAEIIAIEKASQKINNWRLTDCRLYVTIEPCSMCAGAIYSARIDTVIFGGRDFRGGACGTTINVLTNPAINHKTDIIAGVLEDESVELMRLFFKRKR